MQVHGAYRRFEGSGIRHLTPPRVRSLRSQPACKLGLYEQQLTELARISTSTGSGLADARWFLNSIEPNSVVPGRSLTPGRWAAWESTAPIGDFRVQGFGISLYFENARRLLKRDLALHGHQPALYSPRPTHYTL